MHKTAIRIDEELAAEARAILGTPSLTATVNEALREVVDRGRTERFLERMKKLRGLDLADEHLMEDAWR